MRDWVPVSTSARGRLAVAALERFGSHTFESVAVGELAAAAKVTTGALYHHFGSKLGLYNFVRGDVEQRVLDRIGGAVAAGSTGHPATVTAALIVSYDFAVHESFSQMLGAPPMEAGEDRIADALTSASASGPIVGRMLAAAWRAALIAVADGTDPNETRTALATLSLQSRPLK